MLELNRTGNALNRETRNNDNDNWAKLEKKYNDVVGEITEEVFDKIVDGSKIDWSQMVDTVADLPSGAKIGETRGVKEDNKIYRFDGSDWIPIAEINLNPIAEVDDRLSTQLADTREYAKEAYFNLYNGKKRKMPIVSIISDDGGNSDLRVLHPLLESKGIRAGLGIITSRVGTGGYMPWEDIKQMHDMGYEIMSHSHTHQNLRELSEEEIEEDVSTSYEILKERGYNPTGFVYPFNAGNDITRGIVGRYFKAGYSKTELRTQGRNWFEMRNQSIRRVAIGSYFDQSNPEDGSPDTSSLEYYKWRVDEAIENDNWLVFVIHPGSTTQDQWDKIDALLDYIKSKDVPIMLPSDAFDLYGNIVDVRGENEFVVDANGGIVTDIVESGSDIDGGYWIKYIDGTLIYTTTRETTLSFGAKIGSLYRTGGFSTYLFRQKFVGDYHATVTIGSADRDIISIIIKNKDEDKILFNNAVAATEGVKTFKHTVHCVGRWK